MKIDYNWNPALPKKILLRGRIKDTGSNSWPEWSLGRCREVVVVCWDRRSLETKVEFYLRCRSGVFFKTKDPHTFSYSTIGDDGFLALKPRLRLTCREDFKTEPYAAFKEVWVECANGEYQVWTTKRKPKKNVEARMDSDEFSLTGINKTMTAILVSINHSLHDAILQGKDVANERLRRMREAGQLHYRLEVVDKWMEWYGLVNRVVNRAKHKKFLPDGSWISNGVRFGGN